MFATVNTFYLFLLCFCFVFHWICDVMDRADMYGRSVFCIMIQPFLGGCSPLVENEQTWLFHEQLNFKTKRYVSFILIEQPHNACKQKTMLIFKSLCLLCFQAETIHMLSSQCLKSHTNNHTTFANRKICTFYVPLVELMYLVFTCRPGESYCRQFRSLLLYLCYVFCMLINSLVCWEKYAHFQVTVFEM